MERTEVMDFGVLEAAVTLGVIKIVCSLLCFPALRDSFSPVGFCCSCLLIFTDLLVTVFLTLLWLAKPWQPQSWAPSDVIVARVLLFLNHTYGAVMLLTVPLIAVDTACRLRWPLESEGAVIAGDPTGPDSARDHGAGAGANCELETGAEGARSGQNGSLMHLPGFLCCLLVWTLCSCGGERDWNAEGQLVGVCLQTGGSLCSCLPDLLTITLRTLGSPSRPLATFALSLVLALNMGVLRGGWGQGGPRAQTDRRKEDTDTPDPPPPTQPAPPASVHHGVKTHAAHAACAHAACAPSSAVVHGGAEDARKAPTSPTTLASENHRSPSRGQEPCSKNEAASPSRQDAPRCDVVLAIPGDGPARSAASLRGQPQPRCGGRRGGWSRGGALMGLLCAATLCLFPPAMAVNGVLIGSVERLTEWSLRGIPPASR